MQYEQYLEYAREIKSRITMLDIWQRYNNSPIKNSKSLCPFHLENTPSFIIYEYSFYCFGCGVGGDIIRFVQMLDNLSFIDTIIKLNSDYGFGFPIGEKLTIRQQQEFKQKENARIKELERIKKEKQEKEELYWLLWDEWIRLDKNKRDYAPKLPQDNIHPLYVEACHKIEYQRYLIDCLT